MIGDVRVVETPFGTNTWLVEDGRLASDPRRAEFLFDRRSRVRVGVLDSTLTSYAHDVTPTIEARVETLVAAIVRDVEAPVEAAFVEAIEAELQRRRNGDAPDVAVPVVESCARQDSNLRPAD